MKSSRVMNRVVRLSINAFSTETSGGWWIGTDLEGSGRGLIEYLSGRAGENHENLQDSCCPSRVSNPAPTGYKSWASSLDQPIRWWGVLSWSQCPTFRRLSLSPSSGVVMINVAALIIYTPRVFCELRQHTFGCNGTCSHVTHHVKPRWWRQRWSPKHWIVSTSSHGA
jgi:hypothetical protein